MPQTLSSRQLVESGTEKPATLTLVRLNQAKKCDSLDFLSEDVESYPSADAAGSPIRSRRTGCVS